MVPPEHSKLYLWEEPLLKQQLQWQVRGAEESRDAWISVEVVRMCVVILRGDLYCMP